ncbi:MAG: 50S ribosomal protein L17 [Verrucomicrobiae bacterium]|nr:50S ribosomal protein L17 [Verrucomicrobiae bacterium]
MRHRYNKVKLGRTGPHRDAMLANMAVSLIQSGRVQTTLSKAKALRPFAERLVTLGKKGTLHHRRLALAAIRQYDAVKKLFEDVAKKSATRNGGYTRIIKLGARIGDAAPLALIEWVDAAPVIETEEAEGKKTSRRPSRSQSHKPKAKAEKGEASEGEGAESGKAEKKKPAKKKAAKA